MEFWGCQLVPRVPRKQTILIAIDNYTLIRLLQEVGYLKVSSKYNIVSVAKRNSIMLYTVCILQREAAKRAEWTAKKGQGQKENLILF